MKHCRKVVNDMDISSNDFNYRRCCFPLVVTVIILAHLSAPAQTRTVGVISMSTDTSSGYTLFAPKLATTTYLIDNFGRLINSWSSTKAAASTVHLLEDGSILRCEVLGNTLFNAGGSGGRIKIISWDGEATWTYDYSNDYHCQQHDCEHLPNGNVLILAWELKTQSEVTAAGRSTSGSVWPDHIVEVQPSGSTDGEIVWEWHAWDHLIQDSDESKDNYGVVADHPELINVNYVAHSNSTGDWMHSNSVEYNENFDQILLSVRYFDEVWIIDHSTTTEEAASHSGGNYDKGGDLLYRFGNPAAYESGSKSDRILNLQHDAHWIPEGRPGAGNILVFNNGTTSKMQSSVDEFSVPVDDEGNYDMDKAPEEVWSYSPSGFYASNMSSSQRMPNGNTLICDGPSGTFYEVDSDKDVVWEYINPATSTKIYQQYESIGGGTGSRANQCFHTYRYTRDYAAFNDKDMTPGSTIEGGNIITVSSSYDVHAHVSGEFSLSSYTNRSNSTATTAITITIPRSTDVAVKIYNAGGREIATLVNRYLPAGKYSYKWSANGCAGGIYFVKLVTKNYATADRIFLLQ